MARFTMDTGGLNDAKKIEAYLYKLNKNLEYMFSHLTPEENYSEEAKAVYVASGARQSASESEIASLRAAMVDRENVIYFINASPEAEKIGADRISIDGIESANGSLRIGRDGSVYLIAKISASDIDSSDITIGGSGNGKITLKNASGTEIGHMDKTGAAVHGFSVGTSDASLAYNGITYPIGATLADLLARVAALEARA